MRKASDKISRGKQNTHFMFSNIFFPKIHSVCEIMWENMVQPDRPQLTIQYGTENK